MHLVTKNILIYQQIVRDRISSFLVPRDYELVLDEWDKVGFQTMLCRWSSHKMTDTLQLNWDIRERWFHLGYFERVTNLDYRQAHDLEILPVKVLMLIRRKAYANRIADKLIEKVKEHIQVA